MMTHWYDKMIKTLELNGKGERTQQAYARAVRMLTQFYQKTPDKISEQELQDYFLHRKNINKWSPKTMRICYCGIRFFYINVLQHNWHIFNILRAQTEHRLPAILSKEEVRKILAHVKTFHNYVYLTVVYSCGLRLHESLYLEISDIDSKRMMIHVHHGKEAKDRYVPLPEATLSSTTPLGGTP
jgi:site-specific recombinase XerD